MKTKGYSSRLSTHLTKNTNILNTKKAFRESGSIAPLIHNLALDEGRCTASRSGLLFPRNPTRYLLNRSLVAVLEQMFKKSL